MDFSKEIYEELNGISPLLAGADKTNVFSVPNDYFSSLSLSTIKLLNTLRQTPVSLQVPDHYFENLSASILNKIKSSEDNPATELRTLSPMLYSIQNENVFEVPANYFQHSQSEIVNRVFQSQARVIPIKKRDSIWKYAVAAVLSCVIGITAILNYTSNEQPSIQNINESTFQNTTFSNQKEFAIALQTLSDDDIISYLDRSGTNIDNETLTSGIDESELPSSSDYLLDEKTLDTYLNSNKPNSNN